MTFEEMVGINKRRKRFLELWRRNFELESEEMMEKWWEETEIYCGQPGAPRAPRNFTRFTSFMEFTRQETPAGGGPLFWPRELLSCTFPGLFFAKCHFSGSLNHFHPINERKLYIWCGRKLSPASPKLLRGSASRLACLTLGKRARLAARREPARVSRAPHVSMSGRLLHQLIGSIPPS